MTNSNYKEVDSSELNHHFNGDCILVVTATDLETDETHKRMKPLVGYDKIVKVYEGTLTYYFGMLGNYNIAHVQCSMGSLARDSSIMTVSTALNKLKSKIVIMIGIAFGIEEGKQNIGDVLVSESIIPYNTKRIGKTETINRGIEAPASKLLLNRFRNIKTTWEYYLEEGTKAKLITTRLLSGEELVDNLEHRNKLVSENQDSKGGEMEGVGVYAACDSRADWIVVKGICDFADGDKGKNKEDRQRIAINSALSACMEIFNSSSVFNELNVYPSGEMESEKWGTDININDVLFDIYSPNKELYYIERKDDHNFNQKIKQLGIWVHGPSGCGKSNLIVRNLLNGNKDFIQVSLAACIGMDIESFFKEILYEIASKVEGIYSQTQPKSFSECSKAIIELLKRNYLNRELILFVEEIPIGSEEGYREFSGKLFSLLISKNLIDGLEKVRWVLSSINNPTQHLQIFQQKIHQQLHFMQMDFWKQEELTQLINLIEDSIRFKLPQVVFQDLVLVSKGSPRFVKKYFRSVCTLNKFDSETLRFVLSETQRELSQY